MDAKIERIIPFSALKTHGKKSCCNLIFVSLIVKTFSELVEKNPLVIFYNLKSLT